MDDTYDGIAGIDRLATGELDDVARSELFAWLDGEPRRWRRCALALLETREIEQALGAWRAEAPRPAAKLLTPPSPRSQRGAALALAASVLIAFGVGIFARGFWMGHARLVADVPAPRHAASLDQAQPGPGVTTSSNAPVGSNQSSEEPATDSRASKVVKQPAPSPRQTAAVTKTPIAQPRDSIPSYIRGQWERRGYQLSSRPAQLPLVLPDGRRMMASVDEWRLNYVGQRTY